MATVTLRRSDLFPVGTQVGIYPGGSDQPGAQPRAAELAHATVDSDGLLTVTDAAVGSGRALIAAASVGGEWRYARCRSTLDLQDIGSAVGTGDTVSGSTALANVSATSGTFQNGQRITGPGIPGGTTLVTGSGAAWVMSAKATATANTVALKADSAYVWQARLRRRRVALGTS